MKNPAIIIFFVCISFFIFSSCNGPEGPVGPSGGRLTGSIVGLARAIDISGVLVSDVRGIQVSIDGTNIAGTTDSTGRWILNNVPTGTHTINFTKPKYDLVKIVGYQFLGGDTVFYSSMISLRELPKFNISALTATSSPGMITITGNLIDTLPPSTRYIMLFIGTTNTVSSSPANYFLAGSINISSPAATFSISLTPQNFPSPNNTNGKILYFVAHPTTWSGSASYIDFATGRYHYTGLGPLPSNVDSTIIQ